MMTLRKEDDDITQDINILTNSLSQQTIRYPCFRPEIVSKIHTLVTYKFRKNLKFKFYPKITKTGVKKGWSTSINSGNYAAAYYQTLEEVRGSLLPEKNK